MRRPALLLAALLSACGAEHDARFPIELFLSAALQDIDSLQLSLVTRGGTLDCVQVQRACIKDQVERSRFVTHRDGSRELTAWRFSMDTSGEQDLTLRELPLGDDFALVVEAVSKDAKLAGSSCNFVRRLEAGDNTAVTARIVELTPHADCDPINASMRLRSPAARA